MPHHPERSGIASLHMEVTLTPAVETAAKERRLEQILREMGSAIVAYSGGVDSAYLAFAACRVLGDRMLAVTAVSPSLSSHQREKALSFATRFGIPHVLVQSHEFENDAYLANSPDRCYFCKSELFEILERIAAERRISTIVYGINADDTSDFRPGHRAALERGVRGPLLEVGLSKAEIRQLSAAQGLPTTEDPASPCLSSRVPFLERIDRDKIMSIERAEDLLRSLGFAEMRVRHHGDVARIEVPVTDMPRLLDPEIRRKITEGLHAIGFKWVALDMDGFRSGSLTSGYRA